MVTDPILFLDIDGVLNVCGSSLQRGDREHFRPTAVAALQTILTQTAARIVISSSWREDIAVRIPIAFEKNGLSPFTKAIVGQTPVIPDVSDATRRGDEIEAWIASHANAGLRYAVLDDDPAAGLAGNWVPIDPDFGLTGRDARSAIALLIH